MKQLISHHHTKLFAGVNLFCACFLDPVLLKKILCVLYPAIAKCVTFIKFFARLLYIITQNISTKNEKMSFSFVRWANHVSRLMIDNNN